MLRFKSFSILLILIFFYTINSYGQDNDARGTGVQVVKEVQQGNKFAIIIGISDYYNASLSLKYANNDAELFRNYLVNVEKVDSSNISYLIDKEATASNIKSSLTDIILNKINEGDTLIFYFAGHGDVVTSLFTEGDDNQKAYLLCSDANASREYEGTGGVISFRDLNLAVNKVTSKKATVVLILDACRAGSVINEEGASKAIDAMNSNFSNTIKLLSSKADELSYESEMLAHGFFTYYLVLGLSGAADLDDFQLSFMELLMFLRKEVGIETGRKQNPNIIVPDQLEVFRVLDKNLKADALQLKEQNLSLKNLLASRGGEFETSFIDFENPYQLLFNKALKKRNFIDNDSSAYQVYLNAAGDGSLAEEEKNRMKLILVNALVTDAQILINDYISGKEHIPSSGYFRARARFLEIAQELYQDDLFGTERLEASRLFLEAYAVIRGREYSKYPYARNILTSALKLQPKAAYLHNALGLLYNRSENYDSATYHYTKAHELIPTWTFPVNNKGVLYYEKNDYLKAKEYYEQVLEMDEDYTTVFNNLGALYESEGRYIEAEHFYLKSYNLNPTDPLVITNIASLYESRSNMKLAEEWYSKAIATDSGYVKAYFNLSDFHRDNSLDITFAEQLLLKAIEIEPYYSRGYTEYADYLRLTPDRKNFNLADSLYRFAIKNDPYYTWSYAGRGWLHHKWGNENAAIDYFKKAIEVNPAKASAYYYLARYYDTGVKDPENAEKYYLKALEINDYYITAYESLVDFYNKDGRFEKSVNLLEDISAKNPNAPDIWNLYGNIYYEKGEIERAIDYYRKAIKVDSTFAKAYTNLSFSLFHQNNWSEAFELYKKAILYNPYENKPQHLIDLILIKKNVLSREGKNDELELLIKHGLELDSKNINLLLDYSDFLYMSGRSTEAYNIISRMEIENKRSSDYRKYLETMIKIHVDRNELKEAEQHLNGLKQISDRYQLFEYIIGVAGKISAQKLSSLQSSIYPLYLRESYIKKNFSNKTAQILIEQINK